ncbi:unnamed protein product [Heterobilharzia americana]|nr:unnamed protein product [Heterobilharzia americana]
MDTDQVEMKVTNPSSSVTSSIGLLTHGPIPYIRLSNQNIDQVESKHTTNNTSSSHYTNKTISNHSLTDGYINANLLQDPVDAEVEAMANVQNLQSERDLIDDDYFWDSDTGNNEDKQTKEFY